MLRYFVALLIFTQVSFAADAVTGKGSFVATSDDSLSFVNEQLKHEGFADIVGKVLDEMGLNSQLFWQKYNEDFDQAFERVESVLRQKYQMDDNPSAKQVEAFRRVARERRLKMRRNFGGLDRVVQSYSIKKISRSAQNPKARFIRLKGKVDKNLLGKIYYQFVRGKKSTEYGTLYIHVDYNLKNLTFAELGVGNDKDFTEVVNNHWLKWFSQNKPKNIANVEILNSDKLKRLQDYFKLPYEQMMSSIPELFVNSLYLRIEVNMEKVKKDAKFNQYVFAYDGGLFLQALQNAQILSSFQFDRQVKSYPLVEQSNISSLVANYVYRMPFEHFAKLNGVIKAIPPMTSIQRLALYEYNNIGDVYELMKLMENKGIKYSLKPRLESIGNGRAELVVFYDGGLTQLKSMLKDMQAAKTSLSFDFIDTDTVIGIKFNKLQDEKKTL
ncbi:MAG: hypothetical protein CME64_09915 [Halobacteriovoraceae bacterium]|nr:hypothetical protein [Halobacteriovoraceae bacterium]